MLTLFFEFLLKDISLTTERSFRHFCCNVNTNNDKGWCSLTSFIWLISRHYKKFPTFKLLSIDNYDHRLYIYIYIANISNPIHIFTTKTCTLFELLMNNSAAILLDKKVLRFSCVLTFFIKLSSSSNLKLERRLKNVY